MKGRYFTIFLPILTGLVLVFFAVLSAKLPAQATGQQDNCNQETTFTVDEDDDSFLSFGETGNRVQVDFNGSNDDRNEAIITAGSNYQILTVRYDNETFGTHWINFPVSNPTTTINLAGTSDSTRIDKIEVKVKKVCASPSPTPTPSSQPSPSPSPSPEPCDNPEFWGEWYDHHGSCPSPSPTPSPSPSPSPTPEASPSPSPEASPSPEPSAPPVGGGPSGPSGGGNTPPQCPTENLPQKVDQVWFSDIQTGQVTVHWANKGDAHSYQIAYGPSPDNMPWGVEVGGDVSQVTLNDVPAGDLWVRVTANESDECGGQASDAFKVTAAAQPQVLAASGVATQTLSLFAGLGLISAGLWQAQSALKRQSKRA